MVQRSGLHTLESAGLVDILPGCHWGQEPTEDHILVLGGLRLLVWHVMTWQGERPWPGCEDPPAEQLLEDHPEADLILTGHNHVPFLLEQDGRKIMNPGSVMRVKADQQHHQPSVYLWYDDNSLEQVVLPHEQGVVTREHLEARDASDHRRYQAFIEDVRESAPEISFEANMNQFFSEHKTSKKVQELVYASMEKED
jgi:DNA repair exonuclease SbcCD nuclease subunit